MAYRILCIIVLAILAVNLAAAQQAAPATKPAADQDPKVIAAGEWTEEVEGLRGRIVIAQDPPGEHRSETVVYLELRFTTASVGFTKPLYFDPNVASQLLDAKNQPVANMGRGGSGGQPSPMWLTLPYYSTIRLRLTPFGYGTSEEGLRIAFNHNEWTIKRGDPVEYVLNVTFTSAPPLEHAKPEPEHTWKGTLKLPPVKLSMAGK